MKACLVVIVAVTMLIMCGPASADYWDPDLISVTPQEVVPGQVIRLTGNNLLPPEEYLVYGTTFVAFLQEGMRLDMERRSPVFDATSQELYSTVPYLGPGSWMVYVGWYVTEDSWTVSNYLWVTVLDAVIENIQPSPLRLGQTMIITGQFITDEPLEPFVAVDYLNSVFPRPTATIVSWSKNQIVAMVPADLYPRVEDGWKVFVGYRTGPQLWAWVTSNFYTVTLSGPNAVTIRDFGARRCWFQLFCK